jgi:hypothetical protein
MRKNVLTAASCCLIVLLFGLTLAAGFAGIASANEPGRLVGIRTDRGTFMAAQFISQTGSVATSGQIFAGDEHLQFDDTTPVDQGIFVHLEQYTVPSGPVAISADCQGAVDTWKVGPNLENASLHGTAVCFNYITNTSFTVSVDLTVTATGDLQRFNTHDHRVIGGLIFNDTASGAFRPADVSGSISDGNQNFTPNGSFWNSFLIRSSEGTFVVQPPGLSP